MARLRVRAGAAPALLVLSLVVAVGCAGARDSGGSDAAEATDLVLIAVNPEVGRARYRLSCDPARGDVPNPERACAALAADPTLVTDPKPFTCIGGTFSWWHLTLTGRFRGHRVSSEVATCWTPQMALIRELGLPGAGPSRLLPRRQRTLRGGERRTYPAAELRPGDLVVCVVKGKRLEAGVRLPSTGPTFRGWGGAEVAEISFSLETRADGSVHAECDTPEATP